MLSSPSYCADSPCKDSSHCQSCEAFNTLYTQQYAKEEDIYQLFQTFASIKLETTGRDYNDRFKNMLRTLVSMFKLDPRMVVLLYRGGLPVVYKRALATEVERSDSLMAHMDFIENYVPEPTDLVNIVSRNQSPASSELTNYAAKDTAHTKFNETPHKRSVSIASSSSLLTSAAASPTSTKVEVRPKKRDGPPPTPCHQCKGNHWKADCPVRNQLSNAVVTALATNSSRKDSAATSITGKSKRDGPPPNPCHYCKGNHWKADCPYNNANSGNAVESKKNNSVASTTSTGKESRIIKRDGPPTNPCPKCKGNHWKVDCPMLNGSAHLNYDANQTKCDISDSMSSPARDEKPDMNKFSSINEPKQENYNGAVEANSNSYNGYNSSLTNVFNNYNNGYSSSSGYSTPNAYGTPANFLKGYNNTYDADSDNAFSKAFQEPQRPAFTGFKNSFNDGYSGYTSTSGLGSELGSHSNADRLNGYNGFDQHGNNLSFIMRKFSI